ncbi:MAG: hypothetical protein KI793_27095 [Rivularia sp. (in: Bacteria)]|nr:hypothetical protein [Rivularia sp. MS3]
MEIGQISNKALSRVFGLATPRRAKESEKGKKNENAFLGKVKKTPPYRKRLTVFNFSSL